MNFKAMWNNKCPKCRKGDIFIKPLKFTEPLNMPKECEFCGQRTEPEPGFYFGAMFLSYICYSWFALLPTLLLVFYFKWSVEAAMIFAIVLTVVCYLKIARGSRSLWLHMMVKYDKEVADKINTEEESKRSQQWNPMASKNSLG